MSLIPVTESGPVDSIPEKKRIRIAVALIYFCTGLSFASWASRIPEIKTSLHLNDALFRSILFALPAGQFTMRNWKNSRLFCLKIRC